MQKIVLVAIVLALAIVAIRGHPSGSSSSSSSSATHATGSGFLAAQHRYDTMWGDHATDDDLMTVGTAICTLHRKGLSDLQVLTQTAGYRPPAGSKARSMGLQRIADARKYLCP